MTRRREIAENIDVKRSHVNANDGVDHMVALIVRKSMNSWCDISELHERMPL